MELFAKQLYARRQSILCGVRGGRLGGATNAETAGRVSGPSKGGQPLPWIGELWPLWGEGGSPPPYHWDEIHWEDGEDCYQTIEQLLKQFFKDLIFYFLAVSCERDNSSRLQANPAMHWNQLKSVGLF